MCLNGASDRLHHNYLSLFLTWCVKRLWSWQIGLLDVANLLPGVNSSVCQAESMNGSYRTHEGRAWRATSSSYFCEAIGKACGYSRCTVNSDLEIFSVRPPPFSLTEYSNYPVATTTYNVSIRHDRDTPHRDSWMDNDLRTLPI